MKILMQFWKGGGTTIPQECVFFFFGEFVGKVALTKPWFLGDFGAKVVISPKSTQKCHEDLANLRLPWYPKQQPCFFFHGWKCWKEPCFMWRLGIIIQLKQPFRNWMAIRFQVWIIPGHPNMAHSPEVNGLGEKPRQKKIYDALSRKNKHHREIMQGIHP